VPLRLGDVGAQHAQEVRIGRVLEHVLLRIEEVIFPIVDVAQGVKESIPRVLNRHDLPS